MSYWLDLAERAAATYLEAFLGLLIASAATSLDIGAVQAAAVAAIPTGLAVIKAGLARLVGDPDTAAALPAPAVAAVAAAPSGIVTDADPPQVDVPQDPDDHSTGPRVDS